jgi:hypothetical protein
MSTIKSSAENLTLNADGANNDIKFQSNGTEVASIDQAGVLTAGGATLTGDLNFGDNVDANFGAGADLKIYHTGDDSFISEEGSGNLYINSTNTVIRGNGTENAAKFLANAGVELYHDNTKKFETTATGVAVTGGVAIGGTAAANTLDDYEEGTWTPSLGGNASYSQRPASYTKVGNLVTASFDIIINVLGTGSTSAISGLPFTVGTKNEVGSIGYWSALATSITSLMFRTDSGSTVISNATTNSAVVGSANATAIYGNGSRVMGSITYKV